jgi:tetratricopeptide (TPR) repeat protein
MRESQAALRAGDDQAYLQRLLAEVSSRLSRFEDAKAAYQVVIDRGQADAGTFNNRAWLGLFADQVTDQDVGFALQAAQLTQFQDVVSLHTLASLYAESGKTEEAWQTFLKLLELRLREQPAGVDWYIVGRIAEHYSLFDSARAAYRLVPRDESQSLTSTYGLAQRRLGALPRSAAQPRASL